jgi:Mannosyltransferase (PIG-V)
MTTDALPRWARWTDGVALGFLFLGAAIAVAPARVRLDLGWTTLSLGSAWRPLLIGLVLVGVRHWRKARPHLGERMFAWSRRLATPAVALSMRMLLATRLPILAAGCAATLLIGFAPEIRPVSRDPYRGLPARWDATWYVEIARVGYHDPLRPADGQQPVVFFPLYPMLMRMVGAFATPDRGPDLRYEEYLEMRRVYLAWCGVVISLLAFVAALVVLYRWAELHSGADAAAGSVLFLAAYPFAVFYSAPYTESLFLLLSVGACYAFETGRLRTAAAAAFLAALTRPNGMMLSVPLGVLSLLELRKRDPGWITRLVPRLLTAATPFLGTLVYCAYMKSLTGDPFAWVHAQAAWGRDRAVTIEHYQWIWTTIRDEGPLAYIQALPAEAIQLVAVLFAFALVWPVWRRVGAAYGLFVLANLVPPLLQGGLLSMGRFTATLFPIFLALGLVVPAPSRSSWLIASAIGQALIAAVFFTWRPIY